MTALPRVVLITDEPVLARQVEISLSAAGFAVIAAANGEGGLRAIAAEGIGISAVVAEADMPEIGGVEIREVLAEFDPELPRAGDVAERRLPFRCPVAPCHHDFAFGRSTRQHSHRPHAAGAHRA